MCYIYLQYRNEPMEVHLQKRRLHQDIPFDIRQSQPLVGQDDGSDIKTKLQAPVCGQILTVKIHLNPTPVLHPSHTLKILLYVPTFLQIAKGNPAMLPMLLRVTLPILAMAHVMVMSLNFSDVNK